jgi:ATP-dependent RNA helicase DDX51/DBP6
VQPAAVLPAAIMAAVADTAAGTATAPLMATPPVLPWMRLPVTIPTGSGVPLHHVVGLAPALAAGLREELHFHELFPVQAAVWRMLAGGASDAHDVCLCAPTGSGKTLAYALPLLNGLAGCRWVCCQDEESHPRPCGMCVGWGWWWEGERKGWNFGDF